MPGPVVEGLKIGIVAGEASGDLLGAGLMSALKEQRPEVSFTGVGGPRMLGEGLRALHPMDRLSVNGFVDPLLRLPELLKLLFDLRKRFIAERVDAFIGVDFNVFNLLLERLLKRRGIATVHYVSPSVYAWRRGRARRIPRSADLLLTLYPFEPAYYAGMDVETAFVGHPLAHEITDADGSEATKTAARAALGLDDRRVVALLPGSRRSEVQMMAPVFLEAARLIQADEPTQFVLPCLRADMLETVRALVAGYADLDVTIDAQHARRALTACDAALVKSGTSTLEAMCLGRPMVVSYKLGDWSYRLARRLVRTPYIALPNILAGRELVPELLQQDATPGALSDALLRQMARGDEVTNLKAEFGRLHDSLRPGNSASILAADAVLKLVGEPG